MTIASIERLEDRRLMSVSLSGATVLGNLVGRQTFADSLASPSNTQDVRKFTMQFAGTFGASMTGLSANADLQLIRDTNGNSIVDSGEVLASAAHTGTTSETIATTSLAKGTYYLRAFLPGSGTTPYNLSTTADYAGATLATARNANTIVAKKVTLKDFVGSGDVDDFYKLSLGAGRWLTATLNGLASDANLQLIKDANGNGAIDASDTLATSNKTGTASDAITKFLSAGTYFVRVTRVTGDTNYSLALSAPALRITFDYTKDANGFFNAHPTAKTRLTEAAAIFADFTDALAAITPSGSNTWSEVFSNPGTNGGPQVSIANASVAQNTIVVYVGGRSDLSGVELGQGGPGGFSASGTQAWLNTVKARGQSGALATPATDFGPWGGSITFSSTANWNFNSTNPTSGQNDFLSVATHELGHVLGIGTAASWKAKVSGGFFTGANARTANGGTNPATDANGGHYKQGTMSTVGSVAQEVVMDPSLTVGTRRKFTRLDFAGLADIGWQVPSSSLAAPASTLVAQSTFSTTPIGSISDTEKLAPEESLFA